jgi:hypothetical protein
VKHAAGAAPRLTVRIQGLLGRQITVTKIEAARRQLRTALELWFADGDEISIHTLACAAHQVIHDLNRLNKGPTLMFDNPTIPEDKKKEFVSWLTFSMSFFKHADKRRTAGAAKTVDFDPEQTHLFLFMAIKCKDQHLI